MTIAELFPSWMAHEVAFFEKRYNAITTTALFMAERGSWEQVVMWEKILRNCAKAYCVCGELWERDMEECGCWNCGAKAPMQSSVNDPNKCVCLDDNGKPLNQCDECPR